MWYSEAGYNWNRTWNKVIKIALLISTEVEVHMMCVTRKQTLRSLSLSYQKKDGRRHRLFENIIYDVSRVKFWKVSLIPKECFFWNDSDKDRKVCFLVTHIYLLTCLYTYGISSLTKLNQAIFLDNFVIFPFFYFFYFLMSFLTTKSVRT